MSKPQHIFAYFRCLQIHFYRIFLDFSGIRTEIVGVEGEHVHLTTTTALIIVHFKQHFAEKLQTSELIELGSLE